MNRVTVATLLATLAAASVVAQQSAPRFEVASVKAQRERLEPTAFATAFPRMRPGGVYSGTHATVEQMLIFAFNVRQFQVTGGPDWIRRDTFAVDARTASDVSEARMRLMVRSLLADRFRLVTRAEQRRAKYQALVLARPNGPSGPNVHRMADCSAERIRELRQQLPPVVRSAAGGTSSGCVTGFTNLAAALSVILDTAVIDGTEVSDSFFIELRHASPQAGRAAESDPNSPPVPLALEEQLGLKLEPREGPLEFLVVDSVEQPTEN